VKRQVASHATLERSGWPDYVWAFHDGVEIGPKMLARIAKRTGLRPEDL
jgi:predicted RNA binding protein YcfA (HicA-like mRNA interferase family)